MRRAGATKQALSAYLAVRPIAEIRWPVLLARSVYADRDGGKASSKVIWTVAARQLIAQNLGKPSRNWTGLCGGNAEEPAASA